MRHSVSLEGPDEAIKASYKELIFPGVVLVL
jgi:hypothetical protein